MPLPWGHGAAYHDYLVVYRRPWRGQADVHALLLLKLVSFFLASTLASNDSLPPRHHEDGWPLISRCAPRAFHNYRPSGCYGPRPSSYSTSWHCCCQLRSHTLIGTFYRETACRAARHLSITCGSCTICTTVALRCFRWYAQHKSDTLVKTHSRTYPSSRRKSRS